MKVSPKALARRKADARIVEACEGRGVDIETATPGEIVRAYCGWVLGDPQWGDDILDVADAAGYRM
jgi:hypothetical protein